MYAIDSVNPGEIFLCKPYPVEAPRITAPETRSGANTETKNIFSVDLCPLGDSEVMRKRFSRRYYDAKAGTIEPNAAEMIAT